LYASPEPRHKQPHAPLLSSTGVIHDGVGNETPSDPQNKRCT